MATCICVLSIRGLMEIKVFYKLEKLSTAVGESLNWQSLDYAYMYMCYIGTV